MNDWIEEFPGMISVCDVDGKILVMNKKIADYFTSTGGKELIGSNLYDCHSPTSAVMIKQMIAHPKTRIYTTEEDGQKELVIHAPWYQNGEFSGLVEITVPFDGEIPHRAG